MQMIKQCFFLLIVGTAALFMPHAKATCMTPDLPKTVNVASVSVPTELAVGDAIPGTEQTVHIAGSCDSSFDSGLEIVACYYGTGAEIPSLKGVYDSGVPGVGVALLNEQGQRISGAGGVQCNSTATPISYISTDGKLSFNFDITLELVKTGTTVTSGTLSQSQTEFGLGVFGHEGLGSPNHISYAGNVIVKEVTCSVSPQNLTVDLGDVPLSDFVGTGTISAPTHNTFVQLNCNSTVQPEVKVTSGNGYETDFPGVIKLTQQDGMATGVGVRMLVDEIPAQFDTYVNTLNKAIAGQNMTINFSLSYEQVSPEVTPGPANSVATITVAYK